MSHQKPLWPLGNNYLIVIILPMVNKETSHFVYNFWILVTLIWKYSFLLIWILIFILFWRTKCLIRLFLFPSIVICFPTVFVKFLLSYLSFSYSMSLSSQYLSTLIPSLSSCWKIVGTFLIFCICEFCNMEREYHNTANLDTQPSMRCSSSHVVNSNLDT